MKIFDCITYFDEPMLFEVRLNVLDKYVDEFIVAEALYTHSGKLKKINFNKEMYPKFKNRIKHIIVENEPKNIIPIEQNNEDALNHSILLLSVRPVSERSSIKSTLLKSLFSANELISLANIN